MPFIKTLKTQRVAAGINVFTIEPGTVKEIPQAMFNAAIGQGCLPCDKDGNIADPSAPVKKAEPKAEATTVEEDTVDTKAALVEAIGEILKMGDPDAITKTTKRIKRDVLKAFVDFDFTAEEQEDAWLAYHEAQGE